MKICIIGTSTKNIPFDYKDKASTEMQEYEESLACYVARLIETSGADSIELYGATNIELDVAETVIGLRDHIGTTTQLIIVKPTATEYAATIEDCARYSRINKKANHISYVTQSDYRVPELMIDCADVVVVIYNGECDGTPQRAIEYAKKKGKKIDVVLLSDLT
ncbi:MAG: hypothetical protein VZQ61_06740 [Christensenellaceae bacterium]